MDCLSKPMNLKHWRGHTDPACELYGSIQSTSFHILDCCAEVVNQGRYTWQHESILSCPVSSLQCHIPVNKVIHADLPSYCCSENPTATVPLNLPVSLPCSDIVLKLYERKLQILELTVFSNTLWFQGGTAHVRKSNKPAYCHLISDLESRGVEVKHITFEIGSCLCLI